ncbi:Dolichol kinase sec59 [Tolypocladium ophioglossoides CBS 100239]|uniref:dolichol kinase n=1 Tax=Tolypocladium ophioglossoides (strain CBS 100239) TaxID=1163406 RepID=A0A0L0NIQ2_TOLOC|nr:Dolichol kinase sec59 [Tolypocladium ophioglossoides CBS 100239]
MPDHLAPESLTAPNPDEQDSLRALNRTPHPYHHQSAELPHPSERFVLHTESPAASNGQSHLSPTRYPAFSKESTPASDSGTEADDEHFLKGLPAPKAKLHKGLRGRNEVLSGVSTPIPSPATLGDEQAQAVNRAFLAKEKLGKRHLLDDARWNKVLVPRATEYGIVVALGCMVRANRQVSPLVDIWHRDFQLLGLLWGTLLALYPLRVVAWAYRHRQPSRWLPLKLPSNFDPAPLLYPPTITIFVSLLVSVSNPAAILPSIILSICSIPQSLIPKVDLNASYDTVHWVLSCLPLLWGSSILNPSRFSATYYFMPEEVAVLLYPLHQTLCIVLHHLTTTSLLTAELQLLSIALINVLVLAVSPQMQILKALLWVGGLAILFFGGAVIRWGISLARVPKWRFRRAVGSQKYRFWRDMRKLLSWHAIRREVMGSTASDSLYDTVSSDAEEDEPPVFSGPMRVRTIGLNAEFPVMADSIPPAFKGVQDGNLSGIARRHTLPHPDKLLRNGPTHTPSGRRKRATSTSMRPYFKLTQAQATMRKWLYAFYVYVSMLSIIFIGVRAHIQKYALNGDEPIGWGLGYVFGDWPRFRFEVVSANLERWICLPPHPDNPDEKLCHMGWVQHIRHDDIGEANTRLILSGYWLVIFVIGLVVVFQLKETYEVDTRRKVFHFMMVGMFLPATYIDPTYAALALSLVLAIFLILDLLRASQLPPLSKPIASFLAPYVDGRDFRGPVVISHIFLLIGCAIPLWLALAALPRTGTGYMAGWEVSTRDASMVSGVICVGLGDSAASLIGRRYGHRKWLWGGGKSLEGSVAFAAAVFAGLAAAGLWQRIGGWPTTDEPTSILASAGNAGVCASMASLTEAVLTGGNDNVIVPVVLWTCVKSLGI